MESADAIEEFLTLTLSYERNHSPSLEGFLDWLEHGSIEIKRDMEHGRDEVRVMTVHGAKGLEADIVILPDTTSLPKPASTKGHLIYDEDKVLFPLADDEAPEISSTPSSERKRNPYANIAALFYVALTRARDRLYVCGFESKKGIKDVHGISLHEPPPKVWVLRSRKAMAR